MTAGIYLYVTHRWGLQVVDIQMCTYTQKTIWYSGWNTMTHLSYIHKRTCHARETEGKTFKQIGTHTHARMPACACSHGHTYRNTYTHRRPWSILWPLGDLTAQQLLAVWCFTLRIAFHFQTPQPIGEKQRDGGRLLFLFLPFAIVPPTRHRKEHPQTRILYLPLCWCTVSKRM